MEQEPTSLDDERSGFAREFDEPRRNDDLDVGKAADEDSGEVSFHIPRD